MENKLSLVVMALLLLSVLFAYGVSITPVYASTGHPKVGAVQAGVPLANGLYNVTDVLEASSNASIKAGSDMVEALDGVSVSGYFALIFAINDTHLVSFSGSMFDLYISKDGYSTISSDDIKYAEGFSVSDLWSAGLKNVNKTGDLFKGGVGVFWIGTINDTSDDTRYAVLIGPIPYKISGDFKYIKVFDGSTTSVAVSEQFLVILPSISLTPTSGPGGMEVTLEGYALEANELINITENSELVAQVTTDDIGHFVYTWNIVDLQNDWSGSGLIPTDTVNVEVKYNETGSTVDTVAYTEYTRAFLQVISLKAGDTSYDYLGSDLRGYGNGTIIVDAYVFDNVVVVGNFFNPTDDVVLKLGDNVLASVTPNATGYFNVTITVPELKKGPHEVDVWNAGVYYNFTINVLPTLILTPEEGPVGTVVTAKAYGFPAGNASLYWYEIELGDGKYYNLVNATVGDNGKFVGTVTFVVPHTYGGVPHEVTATSTWQGETNSSLTDVVASAYFIVTPQLKVVPSEFSNDGSLVKVVGTGLNPLAEYVPNIDNNLLGVDVWYYEYPTDVFANATGDLVIYFVAAGFTPGLHAFSLYENESLKPLYTTFTVTGPSPDAEAIMEEIGSSKEDILSAIGDLSTAIGNLDEKLDAISDQLSSVVESVNSAVDALNTVADQLPDIVSDAVSEGLSDLSSQMEEGFSDIEDSLGSIETSLSDLSSALDNVNSGLSNLQSGLSSLSSAIEKSSGDTASFLLATLVLVVITLIFAAAAAFKVFKG